MSTSVRPEQNPLADLAVQYHRPANPLADLAAHYHQPAAPNATTVPRPASNEETPNQDEPGLGAELLDAAEHPLRTVGRVATGIAEPIGKTLAIPFTAIQGERVSPAAARFGGYAASRAGQPIESTLTPREAVQNAAEAGVTLAAGPTESLVKSGLEKGAVKVLGEDAVKGTLNRIALHGTASALTGAATAPVFDPAHPGRAAVIGGVTGGVLGAGGTAIGEGMSAVRSTLGKARDAERLASELQTTAEQRDLATRAAKTDAMTGLANRAALDEQAKTSAPGTKWISFDLDNFKGINDTHGEAFGDQVIQDAAKAIREVNDHHFAARRGGDEFYVQVPPGVNAGEVRDAIEQQFGVRDYGGVKTSLTGEVFDSPDAAATDVGKRALKARKTARKAEAGMPLTRTDVEQQVAVAKEAPSAPSPESAAPMPAPEPVIPPLELMGSDAPRPALTTAARDAQGRLRRNLKPVADDDLVREMLAIGSSAGQSPHAVPFVRQTEYGTVITGHTRGLGSVESQYKAVARIDAELKRRGYSDAQIAERMAAVDDAEHGGATALPSDAFDFPGSEREAARVGAIGDVGKLGGSGSPLRKGPPEPTPALPSDVAPAFKTVEQGIDFTGQAEKASERGVARPLSTRLQRVGDKLANGYGPIERLGEKVSALAPTKNPRDLLTLVKSGSHTVKLAFTEGVVDPVTREVVAPSYKAIFAPLGDNDAMIRRALTYVKAKRDVGRGLEGVGGDQTALDAANAVAAHGDSDPTLKAFGERWEAYIDGLRNYAVKSGLWSEDLAKKITDSDALYVPYKRILGPSVDEAPSGLRGGKRLVNVTSGVKRFTGSRKAVANPAQALAEYTDAIIRRADRYRVGASLFDAADALGPAGELLMTRVPEAPAALRPARVVAALGKAKALGLDAESLDALSDAFDVRPDPKNPVIWRNRPDGSREYAVIHANDLWDAVSHMAPNSDDGVRQFLDFTLRPIKRVFTAATTGLNPRFALATNPLRDVIDAAGKSQAGITPADIARGYRESIAAVAGASDVASEAERFGLGSTSIFDQERPKPAARQLAPVTYGQRLGSRATKTLTAPVRALETLGDVSDKGPRLGEYMAAVRKYGHLVDDGTWTPADLRLRAASLGRAVTIDFANKPSNAVMRVAGDYIPFFNAAVQGTHSFGRAMVRNPARMASVSAAVAGSAALAWALKHQLSPEIRAQIDDRPATERSAFLLVPLDKNGSLLRMPLGQEFGVIAAAVTSALDALVDRAPQAWQTLQQALVRALPPGISDLAEGNITVPIPGAQQLLENAKNRRDYGGAPVVPARLQELPPAERRYDTTSPTFDVLASGARRLGFSNTSPLQAENVARGVLSNATNFVTAATDPLAARLEGRTAQPQLPRSFARQPLNPASAVIANPVPATTQSEQRYYALRTQVEQAQQFLNQVVRTGDRHAVPRLASRYAPLLTSAAPQVFSTADDILKDLRDQEQTAREAYASGRLSAADTRTMLDQLAMQRQTVYRLAMQAIDRARSAPRSPSPAATMAAAQP